MVHWFVSATKDIADFYAYVRDEKNTIIYEKTVPYNTRLVQIKGSDIRSNSQKLEICILAKSSDDDVYFVENQCQRLPDDFDDIKVKYNEYYEYKYPLKLQQASNARSDGCLVKSNLFFKLLIAYLAFNLMWKFFDINAFLEHFLVENKTIIYKETK